MTTFRRSDLCYNCPSCGEETKKLLHHDLSNRKNIKDIEYKVEYKTQDARDYSGTIVRCDNCHKYISIPEKAKFHQTKMHMSIRKKNSR